MIAAQMNDPTPTQHTPLHAISHHDQRPAAPACARKGADDAGTRESDRTRHKGFGPLALPALVAATRVLRGGTGRRG